MEGKNLNSLNGRGIEVYVVLSYQDSNLDRQNQKLQCYHYTIRQS